MNMTSKKNSNSIDLSLLRQQAEQVIERIQDSLPWRAMTDDGTIGRNETILLTVESYQYDAVEVIGRVRVNDQARPIAEFIAASPELIRQLLSALVSLTAREREILRGGLVGCSRVA